MPHRKQFDPDWQAAETYVDVDLHGVAQTADGAYAVGASGTVVTATEYGWVPVVEGGPASADSTLRAVAATEDGERIWFAGASGALGMYDVLEKRLYDYSYAGDVTDSWRAIAVTGPAGAEQVLVANGSGAVVPFTVDGVDVTWDEATKPGAGATVTAITVTSEGVAYAADDSGNVYRAAADESWEKIGVPDAQVGFEDVYADAEGRVLVAAESGRLYRYDDTKDDWTPIQVAETTLRAVDVHRESGHVVVLADDDTFYWRSLGGAARWRVQEAPTGRDLLALALGYPDVAVGKSGAVVVHPPMEPPEHEHEEPPAEPEDPKTPHPDPCPLILEELLTRLEDEVLLDLLRAKGCYTGVVAALAERRTGREELVERLREADVLTVLAEELVAEADGDVFREQDVVVDDVVVEADLAGERVAEDCHEEAAVDLEAVRCETLEAEPEPEPDVEVLRRLLAG